MQIRTYASTLFPLVMENSSLQRCDVDSHCGLCVLDAVFHRQPSDGSSFGPVAPSRPPLWPVLLPCIISPLRFILGNSFHATLPVCWDKRLYTPRPPCLLELSVSVGTDLKSWTFSIWSPLKLSVLMGRGSCLTSFILSFKHLVFCLSQIGRETSPSVYFLLK